MNSALYTGQVRHRRFAPKSHEFQYDVFMVLLDLEELDEVFAGRWCWSTKRRALARFRREDHFGDPSQPLGETVRDKVAKETGRRPVGPIRLLTNLQYFGYAINPVSFYFCYNDAGKAVETVLAEVTNTPWGERHVYVLSPQQHNDGDAGNRARYVFDKMMHVSPFMPMQMQYRCNMTAPDKTLVVHLENWSDQSKTLDATLTLRRRPITGPNLARVLIGYPFMTAKVVAAIYFEALRLWFKGVPYHPHPHQGTQIEEASRS